MSEQNAARLQNVFHRVFGKKVAIAPATTAADIPMWDSLTHMQLIAETEKEFRLEFSLDEVMNFNCVGDMLSCIHKKSGS